MADSMSQEEKIQMYRTPERGEDHLEKDLPLGWIANNIELPEGWQVDFVERGSCLRFRKKVSREKYGMNPPGWPGVGITSGSDYWAIIGDTNRVIRDVWHNPGDDPHQVVDSVQEAVMAVERDLEVCRLSALLDGAVPLKVIENIIEKFETADEVIRVKEDSDKLKSIQGVGPAYCKKIQQKLS